MVLDKLFWSPLEITKEIDMPENVNLDTLNGTRLINLEIIKDRYT